MANVISSTRRKVSAVLVFACVATGVLQAHAQPGESEVAACIVADSDSDFPKSYDCWFEIEPADPAWAPQMEAMIWSLVSAAGEVEEVECRTNICRTIFTPSESVVELNAEEKKQNWKVPLRDYFQPAIDGSGGRLSGVNSVSSWSGSPDDKARTRVHMIGRFDLALISEQSDGP